MIRFNNRYISHYRIIFIIIDSVLLAAAVGLAHYLRFLIEAFPITLMQLLVRGAFFVSVFQLILYAFELYDLRILKNGSKLTSRFVQSVATATIALMIAYYIFPTLTLGRGVLVFSIVLATTAGFLWRIVYRRVVKGNQLNERVIILGTGDFAKEIAKEIREKGDSGFEVIGHIDGNRRVNNERHVI
jgi:FlaA1/EpsC-like NDP-sugar epimerase